MEYAQESLPYIVLISIGSNDSKSTSLLELLQKIEGDNYNRQTEQWKISTKYYEALVQIQEIVIDFKDLSYSMQKLDYIEKKEAFIYYFQAEEELNLDYYNIIHNIQENHQPEIGLLFFNGKPKVFKKATEALIDKLVQNFFIEYLKEDLEEYKLPIQGGDHSDKEKQKPKGGLLNGDEKVGLERLIECMHCCMWSNMKKRTINQNQVPQSLINDLQRQEQEKQEFFLKEQQKIKEKQQDDQVDLNQDDKAEAGEGQGQKQPQVINFENDENEKNIIQQLLIEEDHYIKNAPINPQQNPFFENYDLSKEEEEAESMIMLMQQIKGLREHNQVLDDEERRKQAEDMIMKISKYMQLEDDENEDEYYGEEEQEEVKK
ncbi:UNKNOWN [Stylonychia lemnae]|uniref:Uncharacterized protein n=1 Tax=Stylonychia lemnae TaxID=5949 RepID=A0A078AYQ8_STYLE|nr:UNKNOWN [Stylonychia lemnae]|eukprot:CDW86347.1 UNKNOWN [Stylonychia lemnae]